jgi:molybdenum cofactor cytidylyltransferase
MDLHRSGARIGCAILSAGVSREAERATQLVCVDGQPLIERVTLAACRSRVARTAVIVCSRGDEVATAVSNLPVDIISNPLWPQGVASSVRSAVGWARGRRYDALLLAMVDQMTLSTALLDELIVVSDGALSVVGAECEGTLRLPALFPRDCFSSLEGLVGDFDARALLRADSGFPIRAVAYSSRPRDPRAPADLERRPTRRTSGDSGSPRVIRSRAATGIG